MSAPTLELWQTEWCPASHRVRQRLTELGLTYTIHQVPVEQHARTELRAATGASEIPILVAGGVRRFDVVLGHVGKDGLLAADGVAAAQRAKAANAKRKELEAACPKLTATPTP